MRFCDSLFEHRGGAIWLTLFMSEAGGRQELVEVSCPRGGGC
jgi:hypothetical protein